MHPQGYDSFGLPAEQYAIQTGRHPAKTTQANIKRYRKQLNRMGFHSIGLGRFRPQIRNIIVGRNGFSLNYLILIIILLKIRPFQFQN